MALTICLRFWICDLRVTIYDWLMTQDDLRTYVSLMEFVLQQAEQQALLAKLLLAEIENRQRSQQVRDQLAELPACAEADELKQRIADADRATALLIAPMCDAMTAKLSYYESVHERMEAVLAALKKSLPAE